MKRFMDWMTDVFAPKMNRLARNPWLASVQEAILAAMPVILIGSFATLFNILRDFIPQMPDISLLSSFSFGLLSVFLAYLIPSIVMEKKKHKRTAKQAGMAGIAFFLMIVYPTFDDAGNIQIVFSNLGTGGMIASLVAGLFVGAVMNQFAKHSFFNEDSALPDFITVWFDTLIPITSAICLQGMGDNIAMVAAGEAAQFIHTSETTNLFLLGGGGCTLALGIMMLFAKSKKLKIIGRSTIVPSLCNINEPLVFGAPIAFNPLLMVPMWIIGLVGPAVVYLALDMGLVPIPAQTMGFWYLPSPIVGYLVTQSISGVILVLVVFALSWAIYYPFFKVYDKQCVEEEQREKEEKERKKARKALRSQEE